MYLHHFTESSLNQLEEHINSNRMLLENMECEHIEKYKNDEQFTFIPGHRHFILEFSKIQARSEGSQTFKHPSFSILLQNLIQTALNNHKNASKNANRYPDLLMDFAI